MPQTNKKIHPDIAKRRSIVAFSEKDVSREDLEMLFEAARWAPSSRNAQPWSFIYANRNEQEAHERLFSLLNDSNQKWAGDAPVLAISLTQIISPYKNRPNYYAFHDLGMAMGNFLVQATSMDIFVHQMGGYDKDKAREILGIPDDYDPGAMIALGYRGNIKDLPEELWSKELSERHRKELHEFVYRGKFGQTL